MNSVLYGFTAKEEGEYQKMMLREAREEGLAEGILEGRKMAEAEPNALIQPKKNLQNTRPGNSVFSVDTHDWRKERQSTLNLVQKSQSITGSYRRETQCYAN